MMRVLDAIVASEGHNTLVYEVIGRVDRHGQSCNR